MNTQATRIPLGPECEAVRDHERHVFLAIAEGKDLSFFPKEAARLRQKATEMRQKATESTGKIAQNFGRLATLVDETYEEMINTRSSPPQAPMPQTPIYPQFTGFVQMPSQPINYPPVPLPGTLPVQQPVIHIARQILDQMIQHGNTIPAGENCPPIEPLCFESSLGTIALVTTKKITRYKQIIWIGAKVDGVVLCARTVNDPIMVKNENNKGMTFCPRRPHIPLNEKIIVSAVFVGEGSVINYWNHPVDDNSSGSGYTDTDTAEFIIRGGKAERQR